VVVGNSEPHGKYVVTVSNGFVVARRHMSAGSLAKLMPTTVIEL